MSCFKLLTALLCASVCAICISGTTDSFRVVVKSPEAEGDGALMPLHSEEQADPPAGAEPSQQASVSYTCGSSQEREKQTTEPQTRQLLKEVGSICLSTNKWRICF